MFTQPMFLAALLAATTVALAGAQFSGMPMFKHPLTDMPVESEDIETSHYFPEHPDHKFPIGETVTALCHFSNDGSSYYNVSAIMGSLNSPFEFRHHYQNYSYKPIGTVVKAGEEISFKYGFQLHSELEPIEYQLAITVFYDSESGDSYSTTFFNQTVELYYPNSEYDFETVTTVLYSIAVSMLVAILSIALCFPDTKIPVVSKLLFTGFSVLANGGAPGMGSRIKESGRRGNKTSEGGDDEDDWLSDQPATAASASKATKKKK